MGNAWRFGAGHFTFLNRGREASFKVGLSRADPLGSTVESEFVPVESGSDVQPIDQVGSPAPADPVATSVFEEALAPAGAQLYVSDDGSFTMAIPATWPEPIVEPNALTGLDSTYWFVEELSTNTISTTVSVARSRQPAGVTLHSVAEAELNFTRSQLNIEDLQRRTRIINGDEFSETFFVANVQGIELGFYSILRLDGNMAHQVTLTTNVEMAAKARLLLESYLVTLDATG